MLSPPLLSSNAPDNETLITRQYLPVLGNLGRSRRSNEADPAKYETEVAIRLA